jgi:exodeoxyribonuclease V beta subunit
VTTSWNIRSPLPESGITVLEASAGTGKTWQLSALAARLVVERGVEIERIAMITYTRAAAAELRDRVRARLASVRDALRADNVSAADIPGDTLDRSLADVPAPERTARLRRAEAALASFDLATVSTIHSFCQQALQRNAREAGIDVGVELVESPALAIERAVDDELIELVRTLGPDDASLLGALGLNRGLAKTVALALRPDAPCLVPGPAPGGAGAAVRVIVAAWQKWKAWCESDAAREAFAAVRAWVAAGHATKNAANGIELRFAAVHAALRSPAEAVTGAIAASSTRRGTQKDPLAFFYPEGLEAAKLKAGAMPPTAPFLEYESLLDALAEAAASVGPGARAALVAQARDRVLAELRRTRQMGFDEIIRFVADAVADRDGVAGYDRPLARALRERFDAVLVDEFQDTDAAQWAIFSTVFGDAPGCTLWLIGDPKQSIYAFRGADVDAYLRARANALPERRFTLDTNWRSDGALLQAMNSLWRGGGVFGLRDVDYVEVNPAAGGEGWKLQRAAAPDAPPARPLELRLVSETASDLATLVAAEARALLDGGSVTGPSGPRPVRPRDIAVLVRSHKDADMVRRALTRSGIPAVSEPRHGVLATEPTAWLLAWLDAVAAPQRADLARPVAVTPLGGFDLHALARALFGADADAGSDDARRWAQLRDAIREAAETLTRRTFVEAFAAFEARLDVPSRLLALELGERHLTDLRHAVESVHVLADGMKVGPGELAHRLRRAQAEEEEAASGRIRLESDDDAVRVLTIHKSKGLEFPIVLLPGLKSYPVKAKEDFVITDPESGAPLLVLHGTPEAAAWADRRADAEKQGDVRLLYVAMTRAKHQLVAWAPLPAETRGKKQSAGKLPWSPLLALLLRARDAELAWDLVGIDDPKSVFMTGSALETSRTVVDAVQRPGRWNDAQGASKGSLATATYPRGGFSRAWRVTSYSSLKGADSTQDIEQAQAEVIDEELLRGGATDEPTGTGEDADETAPVRAPRAADADEVPLAALPSGRRPGTWVHGVLEALDFAASDDAASRDVIDRSAARLGIAAAACGVLADGLPGVLSTPIDVPGSVLPGGWCLRELPRADRVDELRFDLALAGGTDPSRYMERIDVRAIVEAMKAHAGSSAGAAFLARRLATPAGRLSRIAGLLTGAIDLTFRVDGRYFVADWKTNRLVDAASGRCVRDAYRQARLRAEMEHHVYDLQSLLYTVALHRWLRVRKAGYDYQRDVGGVFYLFVRGMTGADAGAAATGAPGVYFERWPHALVDAVDRALGGEGGR